MKNKNETQKHTIGAFIREDSRILILGSFPSVKSRETNFYYGHKQNRFWRVMAAIFLDQVPNSIEEKKEFLLRNKIAVYDVIEQCDIVGSSDSSIKNIIPSDIKKLIENTKIETVAVNGSTASKYFKKYDGDLENDIDVFYLPSTSPANAKFRLDDLIKAWKVIKE